MISRSTVGATVGVALSTLLPWGAALAQAPAEEGPADAEQAPSEVEAGVSAEAGVEAAAVPEPEGIPVPTAEGGAEMPKVKAKPEALWKDIVVAPRKAVLKARRWELAPHIGFNINDPLVTHFALGMDANYFLTDVLWVGIEASKYFSAQQDVDLDVRRTYRMAARINNLDWGAGLNFGYVPAYGKFTVFNQALMHWEGFVTAGVGVVHTTIVPRDPQDLKFSTFNIAPSAGVGGRIWLGKWIGIWLVVRDYIFNDDFEPTDREEIEAHCPSQPASARDACLEEALNADEVGVKAKADTALVNNIMFMLGATFFLPTDFQYTTFR